MPEINEGYLKKKKTLPDSDKKDDLKDIDNKLRGTNLEKWWGVAQLISFDDMGKWEKFFIRFLIILSILYFLFMDDIIWFTLCWKS